MTEQAVLLELPKRCTKCKALLPLSEFWRRGNRPGKFSTCKKCSAAWCNKWGKDNPEKLRLARRKHHIRKMYGMSLETLEFLLQVQGGRCAICETELHIFKTPKAFVDHDHTTNAVRGLLCNSCNAAIGHFKERPRVADAAAAYLRKHGKA